MKVKHVPNPIIKTFLNSIEIEGVLKELEPAINQILKGDKMLILTRRVGEMLMIGDDVTVKVIAVKGNQVRLGIEAPKEIDVHREEIYNRILEKKNDGGYGI